MNSLLTSPDILAALQRRKRTKKRELKKARQEILLAAQQLASPLPRAKEKAQSVNQMITRGVMVYKGLRLGISAYKSIRNLFGKRRYRD